ncbi:Uncharacterised protein [Ewingella americana]|uniref:Uncharacterized protein n=1 Tax=Ewingella americana TaxID=41202 RepID=A0A377N923_9GAMM|nr:Uncharacterised protein [Ewingella americana]
MEMWVVEGAGSRGSNGFTGFRQPSLGQGLQRYRYTFLSRLDALRREDQRRASLIIGDSETRTVQFVSPIKRKLAELEETVKPSKYPEV